MKRASGLRQTQLKSSATIDNGSTTVTYNYPADVTIISHAAAWTDMDHIKSNSAESKQTPGAVTATGSIRGLDKQVFNCPGGGHATLVLSGTLKRRAETIGASTPIEIGASQIIADPVSFAAPTDSNLRIDSYRLDIRPLGSTGAISSIELPSPASGTGHVEQTLFGTHFSVKCEGRSLVLALAATK